MVIVESRNFALFESNLSQSKGFITNSPPLICVYFLTDFFMLIMDS